MKYFVTVLLASTMCFAATGQNEITVKNENAGVSFTFPWLNYYRYVDHYKNSSSRKFGFFGVGISGYYKIDQHKISCNISTSEDLSSPVAAINYSRADIKTSIATNLYELSYHHPVYDDFGMVAGFNFTSYTFRLASNIDSISSYKQRDHTLGLSLGIEYRFNEHYSVAGVYRPALASFETDGYYRHVINVELRIDLDFKRKRD